METMTIPFSRPFFDQKEVHAAQKAIRSGWVTQGPKVKEFESAVAQYVGAPFACAVSSCTAALHLALKVVGVKPGDVVATVSHSFIATANAVRHCGAEPVFIDIEPNTYNMDVRQLEDFLRDQCDLKGGDLYYRNFKDLVTGESPLRDLVLSPGQDGLRRGKVAAILPVHQMGVPCDILRIVALAKEFDLPVVEDAACAIASEISSDQGKTWRKIGQPHGEVACFSFHPRKILTTGDGGMLTTRCAEWDRQFRLLRQHGMNISDMERHASPKMVFEEYVTTGFNYRMTDIQAAVGIEQLKKVDRFVSERRRLARYYGEELAAIPWITTLEPDPAVRPNWQSYPIRILKNAPLPQRELMQYLLDHGVPCRRGIMNAHQEKAYASSRAILKESELARDSVILLPFFNGMTKKEMRQIVFQFKSLDSRVENERKKP